MKTLNTIENFLTEVESNIEKVEYISKSHTFKYNDLEVRLQASFNSNIDLHPDSDPYFEVVVVSDLTDRLVYSIAYNGDDEWRAKGREVAIRVELIRNNAHDTQWNLGRELEEKFEKLYK